MSDFLQLLVDRGQGRARVLSPRLPSRFEPGPAPAGGVGLVEESETPMAPVATRRQQSMEPRQPSHARAPVQRSAPEAKPTTAAARQDPVRAPEPTTTRVRGTVQPVAARATTVDVTSTDAAPHRSDPTAARVDPADHDPPGSRAITPTVVVTRYEPRSPGRADPQARPHDAGAEPRPRTLRPDLADQTRQRRRDSARPTTAAPPEPTVQVSIGRIEVRAVQADPAPSRQRRPAAQPTSLDDYLAQRNSRRRV